MTKNFTYVEKHSGDPLSHTEWNNLAQDVDALVTGVNNGTIGGSSQGGTDPHVTFDEVANGGKNNLTIATTAEDQYQDGSKTKGGKINIEPISDLQIKPGDDVCLCSHHREDPDEVSVKVLDGEDKPVKLQLNAANIVLTTKDKNKTKVKDANGDETSEALYDDPNVLNVTVNSGKNTRGYLKVRAQAIDLRCEDNGGIALQPKGEDSNNHENKIKFEHNGGDGVEFGTFNTLHTSIFTNDYRFNANGDVYAVTRGPLETTYKEDGVTVKKIDYPTQADDFKDILDNNKRCTWGDIVNAGREIKNNLVDWRYTTVPTAYYIYPWNESGSYSYDDIAGDSHVYNAEIVSEPVPFPSGWGTPDWTITQSQYDDLPDVPDTTYGTKYVYSTDLEESLGLILGTGVPNSTVYQALEKLDNDGYIIMLVGSTKYYLKKSSDIINDIVIKSPVPGTDQYKVRLSDLKAAVDSYKNSLNA